MHHFGAGGCPIALFCERLQVETIRKMDDDRHRTAWPRSIHALLQFRSESCGRRGAGTEEQKAGENEENEDSMHATYAPPDIFETINFSNNRNRIFTFDMAGLTKK